MDIVKIGLVTLDDRGRVLVVRKEGGATFILPGGKPEGSDESDMACLERELGEELGVRPSGALDYMGRFSAPAADRPGDTVVLRAWRGAIHGEPSPRAEIAELRWIDPASPDVPIATSITEHLLPLLTARADGEGEDGGPPS